MIRDTSRMSRLSAEQTGLSGRLRLAVLEYLSRNPDSCDRDISAGIDMAINVVTARRNELLKLGLIEESCRKLSRYTKRQVIAWKVKDMNTVARAPDYKFKSQDGKLDIAVWKNKTDKGDEYLNMKFSLSVALFPNRPMQGEVVVK